MNDVVRRGLVGALSGLVGTAAMTVPILLAKELGFVRPPPPKSIARHAAVKTGTRAEMTHQEFNVAWLLAHLGYGAASGAVFGWLRPEIPLNGSLAGALYGTILWAVSYLGLMPTLGLYPIWRGTNPRVIALMLPAHWLYGAVMGAAIPRVRSMFAGLD